MDIEWLNKIIDNSTLNNAELEQVLRYTFKHLSDRQEKAVEHMKRNVIDESKKISQIQNSFIIANCLLRKDSKEVVNKNIVSIDENFDTRYSDPFEDIDTVDIKKGCGVISAFVDMEYCQLGYEYDKLYNAVLKKNGEIINISCKLRFNKKYLTFEKLLCQLAELYRINKPVIFFPWARRYYDIEIKDMNDAEKLVKCGYKLFIPELEGKIFFDDEYSLMSNIKIDRNTTAKLSDCDDSRYEHIFQYVSSEKNMFIVPENIVDAEICYMKDKLIVTDSNKTRTCVKYNLNDISLINLMDNNPCEVFTNDFVQNFDEVVRIRTRADVEHVLHQFGCSMKIKIKYYGIGDYGSAVKIKKYPKDRRYYRTNELSRLRYKANSDNVIYIALSGESKWREDYAEYVISYLENMYPEFLWAGVVE